MIQLRKYQEQLVADIRASMARHRKVLAVAPTGSGKTVTFSYIASRTRQRGSRIGIFAHRAELLRQISNTLRQFEVPHGIIAAGATYVPGMQVYVCAAQSYARRVGTPRAPVFDVGIIDEAHHATEGSTWAACMNASPDAYWLGVTATPERLDGRGLGETFEDMVLGPTTGELIRSGALADYLMLSPEGASLDGVHTVAGDFNRSEAADAVDRPAITGDAADYYTRYLKGAPAVAFCTTVAHAEHVAEYFRARGYKAASVDGGMDMAERGRRVADFAAGRMNVLTSCDLISEGFDVPGIHGAILLRPTQSLSLYLQQVGRALRTAPGKERAVILDHVGHLARHGLPDQDREWSLESVARSKRAKAENPVRQCERCYAAIRAGRSRCGECGWEPARTERMPETVDGRLVEVDREAILAASPVAMRRREQGSARSLEALMKLGHSESRARHIIAARDEKDALRDQVRELAHAAGVRIPHRELMEMKPKQLRQTIESFQQIRPEATPHEPERAVP